MSLFTFLGKTDDDLLLRKKNSLKFHMGADNLNSLDPAPIHYIIVTKI